MNINFKIAAQTRHEMKPIYQKLNYLVAQTAPNYSSTGRIRTPYMRLTMGDYLYRLPGVLSNITVTWQKDYSWEIKKDDEWDKQMLILPHVLDVNLSFQPIHRYIPTNSYMTPFIGIEGDGVHADWRLTSEGNLDDFDGLIRAQDSDDPDFKKDTSRFGRSEEESYYDE